MSAFDHPRRPARPVRPRVSSTSSQVDADAGYGVIYVNPRGSQGYGEAFTRAVIGDWGGGDFADVMAGLEAALARHAWIDAARLGVMGGSYDHVGLLNSH